MREVVPMHKITFHRSRLGWSKNKLARVTRLTPGDVGKIESGRLIPYPSQIKKIADAFGVPIEKLSNDS
jgi:transcriptional regulator with XRE-family HTH domain